MSDRRYFAKIDVGYLDNPKTGQYLDDRPHLILFHLRAVLYCRQHMTDGVFPVAQVARMARRGSPGPLAASALVHIPPRPCRRGPRAAPLLAGRGAIYVGRPAVVASLEAAA